MAHVCQRCRTTIPEGGLFYRVRLSAVSGYDGVIEETEDRTVDELVKEALGKTEQELEEEVYFEQEVILCAGCRREIVASFKREVGTDGDASPPIPGDRLH
jgi:hypothetical protein